MLTGQGHDFFGERAKPATVTGLALLVACAILTILIPAAAVAQGPPASVASTGFGGHFGQAPGVPASVTSHGWNNPSSNHQFFTQPACCINPLFPSKPTPSNSKPFHHRQNFVGVTPVYVPYSPWVTTPPEDDPAPQADAEDERGGPTIFDRRGSGTPRRQAETMYAHRDDSFADLQSNVQADAKPAEDQPQTLLIYKDGHEDQVQNYAVVGNMLYDLTPGRHRKIALADLDLKATAQQNDDMGISFQVPANSNTP
jgi:hypothetical protein